MARLALDHALPAQWIDEVCQRQYSRELLTFKLSTDSCVRGQRARYRWTVPQLTR